MGNEFPEKLINILLEISKNLEHIHFWNDYIFWFGLINFIILVITLCLLRRYTRATERLVDYQMMPAIDVNMIFDKNFKKTYFWFSNESSLPGFVFLEYKKNRENRKEVYHPLRIPPKRMMRTAQTFDFIGENPPEKIEMVLNITVTPAFDNARSKLTFTKSYNFDKEKLQWNETSWGYPDPSFPVRQ